MLPTRPEGGDCHSSRGTELQFMRCVFGIRKKRTAPLLTRSVSCLSVKTGSTPLYPPSEITGSSALRMMGDVFLDRVPATRYLESPWLASRKRMSAGSARLPPGGAAPESLAP